MWSEYKNAGSVFYKIKDRICTMITSHAVLEGEKLPPASHIASRLAVNPDMVLQVCRDLEREGYLRSDGEMEYIVSPANEIEKLQRDRMLQEFDDMVVCLTGMEVGAEELTRHVRKLAGGNKRL